MKKTVLFVLFIVILVVVWSCGCTGTAPQNPGTTGSQGSQQAATAAATAAAGSSAGTTSPGRVIIDEKMIYLQSGYQTTYLKYAFEDYGYQYLYPNDAFSISVNSDKPVNVLVIDKADEIKFPSVEPEWNTILKKDQWDYSPVVPVFFPEQCVKKRHDLQNRGQEQLFHHHRSALCQ
jgi:hypothetical protein